LPHPCLSSANVRRPIPQIPVQAPLCIAYNLLRPPSHCAFLPNSLPTPSRYSCHIYSQHTLPCSITGANPLLYSLLCQLRQACIYKPVFTPSTACLARRALVASLNPIASHRLLLHTLPTIYQHATNNTADTTAGCYRHPLYIHLSAINQLLPTSFRCMLVLHLRHCIVP